MATRKRSRAVDETASQNVTVERSRSISSSTAKVASAIRNYALTFGLVIVWAAFWLIIANVHYIRGQYAELLFSIGLLLLPAVGLLLYLGVSFPDPHPSGS